MIIIKTKQSIIIYLLIKSNSENRSISVVIIVDTAPCRTGTVMLDKAILILLFRSPIAVRKPRVICTVNSTPTPTATTSNTAGAADNFIERSPSIPANCKTRAANTSTIIAAAQMFINTNESMTNTTTSTDTKDNSKKNLKNEIKEYYKFYTQQKYFIRNFKLKIKQNSYPKIYF